MGGEAEDFPMDEKDNEYGMDVLTLVDEDGVEHEFEVIDTLELQEERYLALVPVFDDSQEMLDDSGELVILKVMSEEGSEEEYLEPIQDEDEFNNVSQIFMHRLEEFYDFEEEE